jgi:hypothetical protein
MSLKLCCDLARKTTYTKHESGCQLGKQIPGSPSPVNLPVETGTHTADHSRRAEMPPQPIPSNPESGGHSWTDYKGLPVCGICGIVKRADGTNKPCKGPVFVEPRDCPQRPWSSTAEGAWEGTGVPKNEVGVYDNEPKVAACPKCLRPVVGCDCNDMVAWVLEINGKCLARWGDDTLHAEFTDPNALRFSRRQDAEWALCVLRATGKLRNGEYPLPVEHVWSSQNETQQEHGCNAPSGEGIADRDPAKPRFFHDHRRSTDNPGEKTIHIRQTERTPASPEPRPAPPPLEEK